MDDKTRSLIKKHIRMLDYIRADLVAILGSAEDYARAQLSDKPASPEVLEILRDKAISPLYADFEAAKVLPVTDGVVPA